MIVKTSHRRPQGEISTQYDRVAPFYRGLEPLFLILPRSRRKAVAALNLNHGSTVVEIGAGTGRNLPLLVEAVGPAGRVIGVDASAGMLDQARKLVNRSRWSNVVLLHQDAAELTFQGEVDAALFSLSYSVIPQPERALEKVWELLRPGGRVVVMDAGLTRTRLRGILGPLTRLLVKLGPGDPYSDPWTALAAFGSVQTEWFLFGIYYVAVVLKPPRH